MQKSDDAKDLMTALAKAQGEFGAIPMDKVNPHFKSKYASLTATQDATRSVLSKNGLALIQSIDIDGDAYYLETMLTHTSGQWLSSKLKLLLDKQNMQGLGSAVTYAKRYAWQAMLGVVGDEDDDANAAVATEAKSTAQRAATAKPPNFADLIKTDPGDYQPTFGKYAGHALRTLDIYELNGYVKFLEDGSKTKPLGGPQTAFVTMAKKFLETRKPQPPSQ